MNVLSWKSSQYAGLKAASFMLVLLVSLHVASGADEILFGTNDQVQITGNFVHGEAANDLQVTGVGEKGQKTFREDIFGEKFAITVSNLVAGQYQVVIGAAEVYFRDPGQRFFDIECSGRPIATNLDLFAAAGGFGKVYYVTAQVEHRGDTLGGPLLITFTGRKQNAKFNTLEIKDASGKSVVALNASELADALSVAASQVPVVSGPELWKDPKQSVDARVVDLVRRMSLAEKARQVDMYEGNGFLDDSQKSDRTHSKPDAVFDPQRVNKELGNLGAGAIHDLYAHAQLYNSLQKYVIQSSRLGIPALFIEEGLHGYADEIATLFPQSVNLATTWNTELARKTAVAIAAEARANGVGMILGPVLDVAREPRWGRVEEDFGEDPFLTGKLGLAYVQGMQGDSLDTDHTVIAEPKHFAGHGSPESGLNTAPVHVGEREVRSIMLKSFEPVIKEGNAYGIMAAYHDLDGVPCAGDPWLLSKVLRGEWGFNGFVLADLGAIRRLYETHCVAASPLDAVCLSFNAGVDMQFYDFDHQTFQNAIIKGVLSGKMSRETLDQAVSRVLRVKFLLGLFEHPFVDETLYKKVCRSREHLDLSLEVGRQSMCLLKNENSLLPLRKDLECIAVIGPNANIARFGDYSDGAKEGSEQGMLEQIKKVVVPSTRVLYSDGKDVSKAVEAAKQAQVIIMGLGEWNGISGESYDRSDLGLPGDQQALLEAVVRTGVPVVMVLQNGRALTIPWAAEHVPAILEAWYPGEFGGRAIAETLFGDNNPAGRLSVTFPRNIGQLPVFYNHFRSKGNNYVVGNKSPQFVFGYGLSYTTFKYDHLNVTAPAQGSTEDVLVSFDIVNNGSRDGDEVAQLYVRQDISSVATPVKALKGFSRVHLKAGETRQIKFHLKQADLAVWGANREWNVEPGDYTIMVGGSSADGMSKKFVLK